MDSTEGWAIRELRLLDDMNDRVEGLLDAFEAAAALPLLQETLSEQRATIVGQRARIVRMYKALGVPAGSEPSPVAEALVTQARAAMDASAEVSRDVIIAQHAVRIEHWALGVWRGLYSVFRMLLQDDVADEIASLISDLAAAERHLEGLSPDGEPGEDDDNEHHGHRLTPRHPYRSPLHQGPHGD